MLPLKDLLNNRISSSGMRPQLDAALALEEFNNAVKAIIGASLNNKIRPLYIKNKVLTVACLSSVLAQELKFHEKNIIASINNNLKSEIVDNIRFLL